MHRSEIKDPTIPPASKAISIALLGNPNSGKTSLFNQLTGLRQKVGNFPGVTVEKKVGSLQLSKEHTVSIIDFPGTYSLYPTAQDEKIIVKTLCNPKDENYPDVVIYVVDVTQLEKHLLLFTQVLDLGLPVILVLSMSDIAQKEGLQINTRKLSKIFNVPVVQINGRTGEGVKDLKQEVAKITSNLSKIEQRSLYQFSEQEQEIAQYTQTVFEELSTNPYQALLVSHHIDWLPQIENSQREQVQNFIKERDFESLKAQVRETMHRFSKFEPILRQVVRPSNKESFSLTDRMDLLLTHRILGPIIFFFLMLLVFQAIFAWANYPMDWIDMAFGKTGEWLNNVLPAGWFTSLLTDGILAGLGGILVFVPQIAILFFLIALLEEVGYMARAVYLFDNIMQRFGLNGRSIVALVSGGACAVPAIMSTRTISNWKERFITILVTPLISCSARIPVYVLLIGFVVPPTTVWGIFTFQGLAFMGLYLLGIGAALFSAWVFKLVLRTNEQSFLLLELPVYRQPSMKNVFLTVYEKVKSFVIEAGQIILIISVVLWALSSFGPGDSRMLAKEEALTLAKEKQLDESQTADLIAAQQLEASYAGHIGKLMEPLIQPLGFDWKIGIALLTSFAAREVFVGTMATIYSIGSTDDTYTIRDKLAQEKDPVTGAPVYTLATSLSLLIFYVFAMQCMSTLAVVKRETQSWKWPIIQFLYMTILAYLGSLLVFQLLS